MPSAPAHVAFSRHPTLDRGVLTNSAFAPLAFHGAVVDMQVKNFTCRVSVRAEYKNDSSAMEYAFAAFACPEGWSLASYRVETDTSFALSSMEEREGGQDEVYAESDVAKQPVCTAAIPWGILAGQHVIINTVFTCPVSVLDVSTVVMNLPKDVVPLPRHLRNPDDASSWTKSFTVPCVPRLNEGLLITVKGSLFAACVAAPKVANVPDATTSLLGDPHNFEARAHFPKIDAFSGFELTADLIKEEDCLNVHIVREASADCVSDAERYAITATLAPDFSASHKENPNAEIVFAVDCSGSMGKNDKIARVVSALRCAISGLPASCFVNVLRFGASSEWLVPGGSVQISAESRADIIAQLSSFLLADQPETKIYNAVQSIYEEPFITGFGRSIVLVTDGAEANLTRRKRILEVASANTHSTRVCAVGIGSFCDRPMLSMVAKVSQGSFFDAPTPSDILGAVVGATSAAATPTLTHVHVEFSYDGATDEPAVRRSFGLVRMIPERTRRVLDAFGADDLRGCSIVVSGFVGSEHFEYRIHTGDLGHAEVNTATAGDALSGSLSHIAAARQRVKHVVEENQRSTVTSEESEEVRRLGKQFSLVTPSTDFVVRVGGGSSGAASLPAAGRGAVSAGYVRETNSFLSLAPPAVARSPSGVEVDDDIPVAAAATAASTAIGAGARVGTTSTMKFMQGIVSGVVSTVCQPASVESILSCQAVDGSFAADDAMLLSTLGISSKKLTESAPQGVEPDVWATCVVIYALQKGSFASAAAGAATLAVRKATAFVGAAKAEEHIEKAAEVLTAA